MGTITPKVCVVARLLEKPHLHYGGRTDQAHATLVLAHPGSTPLRAAWHGQREHVQMHIAAQLRAGDLVALRGRGLEVSEHDGHPCVRVATVIDFCAADPALYLGTGDAPAAPEESQQRSLLEA